MEGAVDVDINQQIVRQLAEALAKDVVAPVVRLDGAENERHFLARGIDDGDPAIVRFDDG